MWPVPRSSPRGSCCETEHPTEMLKTKLHGIWALGASTVVKCVRDRIKCPLLTEEQKIIREVLRVQAQTQEAKFKCLIFLLDSNKI